MEDLEVLKKAREIFEPIPEDQWIVERYSNGKQKCCAVGHWVRATSNDPNDYSESNCHDAHIADHERRGALRDASRRVAYSMGIPDDIASINNSQGMHYTQTTPKQRVMAFLNDAIKFLESRDSN